MSHQDIHRIVEQRVDRKLGFYFHLVAFLLVMTLLIVINLTSSPETWWFIWPLMGWGLGLTLHGLAVFVFGGGSTLRKRSIEAEMRRRTEQS